ncbi:hypothetical protein FS837_003914, partial [Tulasnella sp. UAMH 9824]
MPSSNRRNSPDTHPSTEDDDHDRGHEAAIEEWFSREPYSGDFLIQRRDLHSTAFYSILFKLWIAQLDSTVAATTDMYTYISIFVDVLDGGLPRAA